MIAAMSETLCRKLVRERSTALLRESMPVWMDTIVAMCEFDMCGPMQEMHHRENRSQGGLWTPANIIGLSQHCHLRATHYVAWANAFGLHLYPGEDPCMTPVRVWYAENMVLFNDHGSYREVDTPVRGAEND